MFGFKKYICIFQLCPLLYWGFCNILLNYSMGKLNTQTLLKPRFYFLRTGHEQKLVKE